MKKVDKCLVCGSTNLLKKKSVPSDLACPKP